MRKLKRCRSSWAPAVKEIAALWHGELVLAIEQGVKLKRALHLSLRERHAAIPRFDCGMFSAFVGKGFLSPDSGTLANKKQQYEEQPG